MSRPIANNIQRSEPAARHTRQNSQPVSNVQQNFPFAASNVAPALGGFNQNAHSQVGQPRRQNYYGDMGEISMTASKPSRGFISEMNPQSHVVYGDYRQHNEDFIDEEQRKREFFNKNFAQSNPAASKQPAAKRDIKNFPTEDIPKSELDLLVKRQESLNRNISLYVRVRPILSHEKPSSPLAIQIANSNVISVISSSPGTVKQYSFNRVFNEYTSEIELFQVACMPMLNHCLEGYNSSLFLYGQTGTGKTHTMGLLSKLNEGSSGLVVNSLKYLYEIFSEPKPELQEWEISLSFMEIYLEEIRDLLNPDARNLSIREDTNTGEPYVQDLVIVPVENLGQAIQLVNAGLSFRVMASQNLNESSSRSHLILTIYINQRIRLKSGDERILYSRASFIDLAGSERIKKSNSRGLRLDEAKIINSSLSALGIVISALATKKAQHIPYRATKMTRILQSSLSGECKVVLIGTISQLEEHASETNSTLTFIVSCKDLQFKPVINAVDSTTNITQEEEYRAKIEELEERLREKEQTIEEMKKSGYIGTLHEENMRLKEINIYVLKLLSKLEEFLKTQSKSIQSNRNDWLKSSLEKLAGGSSDETLRYNFFTGQSESMIQLNSMLLELDQLYGQLKIYSDEQLDREVTALCENYDSSSEEILEAIQKRARNFSENVKCLVSNGENLERLKMDSLRDRILLYKKQQESDNWLKGITYLMKISLHLKKEKLKLENDNRVDLNTEKLMMSFASEIEEKLLEFVNLNNIYMDPNQFRKKIQESLKKIDPTDHFSNDKLVKTLAQLRIYSNNSEIGPGMKDVEIFKDSAQGDSMRDYQESMMKNFVKGIYNSEMRKAKDEASNMSLTSLMENQDKKGKISKILNKNEDLSTNQTFNYLRQLKKEQRETSVGKQGASSSSSTPYVSEISTKLREGNKKDRADEGTELLGAPSTRENESARKMENLGGSKSPSITSLLNQGGFPAQNSFDDGQNRSKHSLGTYEKYNQPLNPRVFQELSREEKLHNTSHTGLKSVAPIADAEYQKDNYDHLDFTNFEKQLNLKQGSAIQSKGSESQIKSPPEKKITTQGGPDSLLKQSSISSKADGAFRDRTEKEDPKDSKRELLSDFKSKGDLKLKQVQFESSSDKQLRKEEDIKIENKID